MLNNTVFTILNILNMLPVLTKPEDRSLGINRLNY